MTTPIGYSNKARADLLDIWTYIGTHNPDAADRQIDRIAQSIARFQDFPEVGHARDDAGRDVKVIVKDSYLIIYRYNRAGGQITIERILHGRRDLSSALA